MRDNIQNELKYNTYAEKIVCVTSPFKINTKQTIVVNWIKETIQIYNKNGELIRTIEKPV